MIVLLLCLTGQSSMTIPSDFSVGIIGAGVAGLRAAQRFEQLGIDYTIFEGSNRIGGRVFPFEYQNGFLQFGAEYVNGVDNEIYEIVRNNGLISEEEIDEDGYEAVIGGVEVGENLYKIWDAFETSTNEKLERDASQRKLNNQTVSQRIDFYFETFLKNQKFTQNQQIVMENLKKIYKNQYQIEWSAPANDLCLKNLDSWDSGVDSEFTLNRIGFKGILDEMTSKIPENRIFMESKVVNVDYSGAKVKLLLSNGQIHFVNSVIITSSLGFLKLHKNDLFSPQLPIQKTSAIDRFGFGSNLKIFLEYEKPWWPRRMSTLQIAASIGKNGVLEENLMVYQPSLWAKNILVAWLAGDGPSEVSKLSDPQLISSINNHLTTNLKNIYKITKISKIYRHDWISDEFALGSYSYISNRTCQENSDDIQILKSPILKNDRPVICFAGEHTDAKMYQTVVGAARSGLREADRIFNSFSTK